MAKTTTHEGAIQYDHSLNHALEFFSKAGSLYSTKTKKAFYGNENEAKAVDLFVDVWASGNKKLGMQLLFWLRDCRGGAGNRSGFRDCLKWLAKTDPAWVEANVEYIPAHGRWDDCRVLFGTPIERSIAKVWGDAISNGDHLASKWADRNDKPILNFLRYNKKVKDIGDFRRMLARNREGIVERNMCFRNWKKINYEHVPSVAMSRYTNAFNKNDAERFADFKQAVEKGEKKIKASVLFPHDCARTVENGDAQVADAQFNALPNFLEGANQRIMTIVDSSDSMNCSIGGGIRAIDVSTSLGLYCSDRLGKNNPFYRSFMQFSSESKLNNWKGKKFSQAINEFNGAIGGTRIDKALDTILNFATSFGATNEQIPNVLLIVSDMQFHEGTSDGGYWGGKSGEYNLNFTEVEKCMTRWENAGYTRPKILYWNLAGYAGAPTTINHKDVGLVSGFSPSILKAVFGGEDFSPEAIMLRAVEKYKVNVPA